MQNMHAKKTAKFSHNLQQISYTYFYAKGVFGRFFIYVISVFLKLLKAVFVRM